MSLLPLLLLLPLQGPAQLQGHAPAPRLLQRVWVVDATGNGQFPAIQPAIDAARAGDLILVRPGTYPIFTLEGKGLSVLGVAATPRIEVGAAQVRDLSPGEVVVLRNLAVELEATDVAGVLWLEELSHGFGFSGNRFQDVAGAVVVRSQLSINPFVNAFGLGNIDCVTLDSSALHLFESSLLGGDGAGCQTSGSKNGGDAIEARDGSFLFAYDATLTGGKRGATVDFLQGFCVPAGLAGLSYRGAGQTGYELDSAFPSGTQGTITTFNGVPRSLAAPALVEDGATVPLTITGPPGDTVVTLHAPRPDVVFAPILYGTSLTGLQPVVTPQGVIPASGVLEIELALPALPAGHAFQSWVVQSLQIDAESSYLSSGSLVHVVAPGTL